MIGYVKCFDDNKTMSFLADDTSSGLGESRKEFLKEYVKVWEKIRDLIGKKFNSEPVYGDKYIKTKIKSCNNDIMRLLSNLTELIREKSISIKLIFMLLLFSLTIFFLIFF